LADPPKDGWTVDALAKRLGCGPTTVYEILRALRPLGVIETRRGGGLALARTGDIATPLRRLLRALAPFEGDTVDRPPRRRGRT
jgi:Mn-dependent DtxR family transcriptional regulator